MKYLYINNGKGFYSTTGLEKDKQDISNILKDDILIILNKSCYSDVCSALIFTERNENG